MAVLTSSQRNTLEKAVIQARKLSESGAFNALRALAVHEPELYQHQTPEQRTLRNRLRSKARLLGDELVNKQQSIQHLAYELAYEYWHKMLFASFLEANDLLIHPKGVPVTMEECEELAKEEGHSNKWSAAASYASQMLPAIFRVEDPLMQVEFAPNDRIALESLLEQLDEHIFTADDALGWVYQFWQSDAKKKVEEEEKSGQKIDGDRLPAKTQLFTEPYMVHFLIENTLGAWWVSRNPGIKPPINFEYLRLLENGEPAAGNFEGWPDNTAEVTSLDPCMGSGHFVTSLFTVFTALRIHEEGLTKEQATDKVIAENLHGLELDARCTQIAAFNLALTAWKFCGHYKALPEMNLACSGIAPKGKVEDWLKLVGKVERTDDKARMENGIKILYKQFQLAPELGSLLDPTTIKSDVFTASFEELQPVLKKALENEADSEQLERGVIAAGLAKAGQLLSKKYTLQITNVPFLLRRKQSDVLALYGLNNLENSRHDLATMFLEKIVKSNKKGCTAAVVIPQNWNSLPRYKFLRKYLLNYYSWNFVARLGSKCFQTQMWDFNVLLFAITSDKPNKNSILTMDVSQTKSISSKVGALKNDIFSFYSQQSQLSNPDLRIVFDDVTNTSKLSAFADSRFGLRTADTKRFIYYFWEVNDRDDWSFIQSSVSCTMSYSGKQNVLFWEKGKGQLAEYADIGLASLQGGDAWGKKGVVVSLMGDLPSTIYEGNFFDNNCAVIWPLEEKNLLAIWAYCSSTEFKDNVRKLDQKLNVTNATLLKIPFEFDKWQNLANNDYPQGLPRPYSDDPSQWLFHGHPIMADNPLQIALARVLGYRWPAETNTEMELTDEARTLISSITAYNQFTDEDGILCIPSVNGEPAAGDHLRTYLQKTWGIEWNNHTIEQLIHKEESSKSNLEEWLREDYFIQHCKVFQNRPFIWHIWDGRKDGFGALVNYHKLTKENLEKLIFTYLGDWIRQCESRVKSGQSGADGQLSAAKKLKEKLELILVGETPHDIFIRWKKLEEQPIGWDPDLNDGVRLNIRPFIQADVLRKKPNIKWGIDRGNNPPGSPWGEKRDNDRHLSLEEKRNAKAKATT